MVISRAPFQLILGSWLALCLAGCFGRAAPAAALPGKTDFSFGHGTPFGGQLQTQCGLVTVATENTINWGAAIGDDLTGNDAMLTFSFERPPSEFVLELTRVRADELLHPVSASPVSISGDLTDTGDGITTTRSDDFGAGSIVWRQPGLGSQLVLKATGPHGAALGFASFTVMCDDSSTP